MTAFSSSYPDAPATRTAFTLDSGLRPLSDLLQPEALERLENANDRFERQILGGHLSYDWNRSILDLALEFDRDVVFNYQDAAGRTTTRIITPERVDNVHVSAETPEGYRQFRLDRIQGEVSVRPSE